MNATEMAVLSGFWQRNGLGTLGVNHVVESYENCWAIRIFFVHMLCKNFNEK